MSNFKHHANNVRGVSAVEVVLGVSIIALIVTFVSHSVIRFVNTGNDIADKTQALYLAEEELEFVRFIHDNAWSNISVLTNDTTYYIEVDAFLISVTTTPEVIEGFSRSFWITDVYRDANDDIVASTTGGSVADPDSKYVTSVVSWGTPTSTVSLTTILADIEP